MRVVGQRLPRYEGAQKASGSYLYASDLVLPRMLHAAFRRSDRPHARLVRVDAARARRVPGVVAVITGQDCPQTFGIYVNDEPVLAREVVRYVGEPVAAVSAASPEAAAEAAALVEVEYEDLVPVFDPGQAMAPGAPLIHPRLGQYQVSPIFMARPGTNVCTFVAIDKGDVEAGFAQSDEVFEAEYHSPMVAHVPLETHVTIAQADLSGRVTLWGNTQSPFLIRRELAMCLGLPLNKVRVIVPGVGGGFGGKSYPRIEPLAACLALASRNRPVKVELSRREEFETTVHKEPCRVRLKTGVKRDGRLKARQVEAIYDAGAYAEGTPLVTRNACFTAAGPYDVPHAAIRGFCVYTNNQISGPMRGFGTPQLTWAYESQMDEMAAALGLDPVEIRLRNCLKEGDELPSGEILGRLGLRETIERAAQAIGWSEFKEKRGYGVGLACCHKLSFSPATSSAVVRMDEDGSVQVACSTVEMGQGSNNVLIQIAAEALGLPFERVAISQPDTDYTPYDQSTTGSRSTFTAGNAVLLACEDLKSQFLEIASKCLDLPGDELVCVEGKVKPKEAGEDRALSYEELIQRHFKPRKASLVGRAVYTAQAILADPRTGKTPRASAFWMYGTQAALVKVDQETGQVDVLKAVSAYDLGKTINPLGAEGQLEGGVVQGLGTVIMEELVMREGRLLNPNLRDYPIPTILDCPEIEGICVEAAHEEGPFGAKGLGELVLNATAPAVANAVFRAAGVRIRDLPLTAEKVHLALKRRKPQGGPGR